MGAGKDERGQVQPSEEDERTAETGGEPNLQKHGSVCETGDKSSLQKLADAKKSFGRKSTHYPNAAQKDCGARIVVTKDNCQKMHEKIKIVEVNVPQKIGKSIKIRLRREWFHPIA